MSRPVCSLGFAAMMAAVLSVSPSRAATQGVLGDWVTPGGARVLVAACPDRPTLLCGILVSLKRSGDAQGAVLRDTANPNATLRDRPLIGLTLIERFRPAGHGHWVDGHIYDPGSGKTYGSKMTLEGDGTLKVEGCVLIICSAQTWTRPG